MVWQIQSCSGLRTILLNVLSDYDVRDVISSGVPQRSILGPLLFVLFINDLPGTAKRCSVLMYADDAILFYATKDVTTIEAVLNMDMDTMNIWLRVDGLFLRNTKTECVLFGTSERLSSVDKFAISIEAHVLKTAGVSFTDTSNRI